MVYVALLRGINVGGKNKVDMKKLKETFARAGMSSVITYINSGNVIFIDKKHTKLEIAAILEKAILEDFHLVIKVLIRSLDEFETMMKILPNHWKNDNEMKGDVLFLWEEVNEKTIHSSLVINPSIDTVLLARGAVLWSVAKENVTKSGLVKIVGTPLYKQVTVRNVNTTRKVYELMSQLAESVNDH